MAAVNFFDSYWQSEKMCYTSYVKNTSSETLQADISRNQHNHKRGKTNDDVIGACIGDSPKIEKLPAITLTQAFKNIKALIIDSTGLKDIAMNDLIGLENVTILWIENNNQLVSLPGDLFKNMPHLQSISFRNNNIKFIGKDLLKPLNEIEFIDLRGNAAIDAHHGTHKYETNPGVTLEKLNIMIRKRCRPMNPVSSCADDNLRFWKEGLFSDFMIRGKQNRS